MLVIADSYALNTLRKEEVSAGLTPRIGAGFNYAKTTSAAGSWNGCLVYLDNPLLQNSPLRTALLRVTAAAETAKSDFLRFTAVVSHDPNHVLELRVPATQFNLNGWGTFSNGYEIVNDLLRRTAVENSDDNSKEIDEIRSLTQDIDFICSTLSFLLQQVCVNVCREMKVVRVTGERSMLKSEDVIFKEPSNSINTVINPLQRYAVWLGRKTLSSIEQQAVDHPESLDRTSNLVNDALGGELFPTRAYQVKAEVSRMTIEELVSRHAPDEISESTSLEISLYLEDSNGRVLNFGEVGSGVSYVMPVLAALWGEERAWIEQPELHLHAAAQCALGDVLLRSFNRGQFAIVETHSEHLLLRILRRIRQTHQGKINDPELRCFPEAVAVLYFDPQEDGGTHVYPLRISRSGDFMDRWPSGFFEEREQELFDE